MNPQEQQSPNPDSVNVPQYQAPQMNPAPVGQPAYQPAPQPSLQSQPVSGDPTQFVPNTATLSEDSKIFHLKYLLAIFAVSALFAVIQAVANATGLHFIKLIFLVSFITVLVLSFKRAGTLKKNNTDVLTKSDKFNAVLLMAVDPLISQAVYYYRLRKTLPQAAKTLNKIGWKVLFVEAVPTIILLSILTALIGAPSLQKNAWNVNNAANFSQTTNQVISDISQVGNSVVKQDSNGVTTDCEKLGADVSSFKSIPAYPNDSIANKVSDATQTLSAASTNCKQAIQAGDINKLNQSGSDMLSGSAKLKSALTDIDARKTN